MMIADRRMDRKRNSEKTEPPEEKRSHDL